MAYNYNCPNFNQDYKIYSMTNKTESHPGFDANALQNFYAFICIAKTVTWLALFFIWKLFNVGRDST